MLFRDGMNSQNMSKATLSSVFLRLSMLLVLVGTLMVVVKGAKDCSEGLGTVCGDNKCNEACVAKHAGGEGSCQTVAGIPLCTCFFDCPPAKPRPQPPPSPPSQPPKPKVCNGGAGLCSVNVCGDDCCNKNCAAMFNNGSGFCSNSGVGPVLCQCQFPCT